jgi:hypothetical protein
MILSSDVLATILVSTALSMLAISLFFQVFHNFKIKTTKGFGDLFILGLLNMQACYIGFTFARNLPLIYKIINPLYGLLILILIIQRFMYLGQYENNRILPIYVFNVLCATGVVLYAIKYNVVLGNMLGWIPIFIALINEMGQGARVHFAKSVVGLNPYFVLGTIAAYVCELIAVIVLKLPTQVMCTDIKSILVYSFFFLQFLMYRKRDVKYVGSTTANLSDVATSRAHFSESKKSKQLG